jgi:hypothetical protein
MDDSGAPMGSQICPSDSNKCAKWARGHEIILKGGPAGPEVLLQGAQSGTQSGPKGSKMYQNLQKTSKIDERSVMISMPLEVESASRSNKLDSIL